MSFRINSPHVNGKIHGWKKLIFEITGDTLVENIFYTRKTFHWTVLNEIVHINRLVSACWLKYYWKRWTVYLVVYCVIFQLKHCLFLELWVCRIHHLFGPLRNDAAKFNICMFIICTSFQSMYLIKRIYFSTNIYTR